MKKSLVIGLAVSILFSFCICMPAIGADLNLAKKSTIEKILKRGELRVGFESGYMPFEMTNKKGKFMGFDIDMAKALAKSMGVKFVPVNTQWDGIIASLMTDKFDVIIGGMTITQKRNLQISFSNPYIVIGQTILVNNRNKGKVKSYKDLNHKKYVVTGHLGTTGEQAIKKYISKATYKGFESQTEAALEVLNGNADAIVYDLPFCAATYAMQGKGKVFFLDKPFTFEPLAMAINRGDPDFLNFLNGFIRQYKNDGRWQRAYDKWLANTDWQKEVKK